MTRGTAILMTSIGILTIYSPFKENMTKIVNSNAIKVIGLILGINFFSYHSLPFNFSIENLVIMPPKKGIPR